MRPDADKGLWCSFLLLSAFIAAYLHGGFPERHYMSIILCIASSILVWDKEKNCLDEQRKQSLAIIGIISAFLCLTYGLNYHLLLCTASLYLFHKIYNILLSKCPKSFTCGEAAVVAQLVSVMFATFLISFLNNDSVSLSRYYKSFQIIILTCISAVMILYMFPTFRVLYFFYPMCLVLGIAWLMLWSSYMGENAFLWMSTTAFENQKRVYLILVWCVMICASVLFVNHHQNKPSNSVSTVTRKWFHLVIAAVYLPGIFCDINFLFLASSVAIFIFTFLEAVRVLKIWPLGDAINDAFQIFLDEKDSGFLILTHIYLLVGCSCPLWILPPTMKGFHISHMSGIISVAFGDTVASAVGSTYGKHNWRNSKKTIEGTVAAVVVQLISLMMLLIYCDLFTSRNVLLVIFSAATTSLLEAKTTQVDNLVLPLFMFVPLSFIR